MPDDSRRLWTSLQGLTINSLAYAKGGCVRLRFTDGTFLDVSVDDAWDEYGNRLVLTSDVEDAE